MRSPDVEAENDVKVSDLLAGPVVSVRISDAMKQAGAELLRAGSECAVVLDGELPVGLITLRDFLRAADAGVAFQQRGVAEWMHPSPPASQAEADVGRHDHELPGPDESRVVILAGEVVVGMVPARTLRARIGLASYSDAVPSSDFPW